MTRNSFVKKWLANPEKEYNDQTRDEMLDDLDLVMQINIKPFTGEMYLYLLNNCLRHLTEEQKSNLRADLEKTDPKQHQQILEDLEKIQNEVEQIGFKGSNEFDLHLREEIVDYILTNRFADFIDRLKLKLISMSCFAQEHMNDDADKVTQININEIREFIKKQSK